MVFAFVVYIYVLFVCAVFSDFRRNCWHFFQHKVNEQVLYKPMCTHQVKELICHALARSRTFSSTQNLCNQCWISYHHNVLVSQAEAVQTTILVGPVKHLDSSHSRETGFSRAVDVKMY